MSDYKKQAEKGQTELSEVTEKPESQNAETKVATVENNDSPQLTPMQQMQGQVTKYVSKMLGRERASEFATRVAIIARDNLKLRSAIERNPDSFLSAYLASASLDLMPNTPEALAYIIPYGDNVQFQTGYKGLVKLARRSGEIKAINAELVFKGDVFDVEYGTERKVIHKPNFELDRTDYKLVTHAYASAKLTNGEDVFVVMTRSELDKVKNIVKAKSTDAPWQTWPERMALKTVLKRLTQLLPSSTDDSLHRAVVMDSLAEAGKLRLDKDSGEIIEGETVEITEETRTAINVATTREELNDVLMALPLNERRKAQPLVNIRMKEL